jgi:hypothetical protein
MSARLSLFWITLGVALLVVSAGCGRGGARPTGEGLPPVSTSVPGAAASGTGTPSAADTAAASAAATRTGQAQSGQTQPGSSNGSGNGNGSERAAGGTTPVAEPGGGSGNGNPGGGNGAEGAPLHIPAVILNIGSDLQTEYGKVVADVTSECGGTLCVSVSKQGTGYECGSIVTVNGAAITPVTTTDSQGNDFITVPRGANIVINGNALGLENLTCPSEQPAVAVAGDWFTVGKPIGGSGDGGAFAAATAAITTACGDGTSCVSLKVAGGPNLCDVDPQPGVPVNIPVGSSTDIKVLRGGTITLNGNADGSSSNCPSGDSGTSGGTALPSGQADPAP